MADKNFARSGTADTDLLADDDPLSELARIVGYDPQPVSPGPAVQPVREAEMPAQTAGRPAPLVDLEDELLREFALYDAPTPVAAEPVFQETPAVEPEPAEPAFDVAGEPEIPEAGYSADAELAADEDALLREFALYDAPTPVAADPVDRETPA
ncbi:SPOR domain-containing protein, partial [Rhizobium sp. TRM95111]|nr:SPOR domain-containing protein [Rhizobium alarense]